MSMAKPMDPNEYIRRAKEVHGSAYDYSVTEYQNMHTKVSILCPKHGVFQQFPQAHLRGQGCPICGREKQKQTMLDRYGVDNPIKHRAFYEQARTTCQKKYGHDWAASLPEIQAKIEATNLQRYGTQRPLQAKRVVKSCRVIQQRVRSLHKDCCSVMSDFQGTQDVSQSEERLYEMLCSQFGTSDVLRQYRSAEYPFACDFYIKSRHLYVELNGSWTHGQHWFRHDDIDEKTISLWQNRNTPYYQNAIRVWTEADVRKREKAADASLNYVVFWDCCLRDAQLWFSLNCPDGQDWKTEYSWLPEPLASENIPRLTGTASNLSRIAKAYQFSVFYHRELQMWQQNEEYHGIPLHVWLYANRLKYLGKSPSQLTLPEVMRGFTISGVLKGYTVFHTGLMDEVIQKYHIQSVYDPCAGWGERMLYCFCHHISYLGVDVNQALALGYDRMMSDFCIKDQRIVCADSGVWTPNVSADAVITCPPYGDIEKYSDAGAENLDEVSFLTWWDHVVSNSMTAGIQIFAFQVNQRWRDRMLHVVEQHGFQLVEELMPEFVRSSHFHQKNGVTRKREFESMLVLEREFHE